MRRNRSVLVGALAVVSLGSTLGLRSSIAPDPVLGTGALNSIPALVLADEPAQRIVTISAGMAGRRGFGGGGGSFGGGPPGAAVQVLDEQGQMLRAIDVGQRPSQALIDPSTGNLLILTATTPGSNDTGFRAFFATNTYLSIVDPVHGAVLRSIAVQQSSSTATPTFGGGRGFGRRFGANNGPSAPWRVPYQYATSLTSGNALALDAKHRRIFVGTGGATGQPMLTVFDADSGAIIRSVPMPASASALAVDPTTGRLFVADQHGDISILDERALTQLSSVSGGGTAAQIAFDAHTNRAFVLASGAGTVTTIDGTRGTVVSKTSVGANASGVQVDQQTGYVWVESAGPLGSNVLRPGLGRVSMIDAATGKLVRTISVGSLPFGAALDTRHHQLFVSSLSATGDGVSGTVQVLDTVHGSLRRTVALSNGPLSVALDTKQERVAIAGMGADSQPQGPLTGAIARARTMLGPVAPPTPTATPVTPATNQGVVTVLNATS